ncbi:MAG: endonuclease/exonuclease/phosphatase family protein [Bacteroidales bacterium]|nr:endonuclease/exonuclease/phosphatase family protein [Bacteroidales bacterium]
MQKISAKAAILTIACIVCTSCRHEMTIMTYNVGVFEKSGSNSMHQVAEIIKAAQADIVSMNELDSCNLRHSTYQLEEIAQEAGGLDFHFAQAFPFAEGAYGNGIISKSTITARHIISLPVGNGAEPRSVAVAETEDCVFASVHLDHIGEEARIEQAKAINEWFTEKYSGSRKPVILCGDMNDTPESATIRTLSEKWERLSGTAPTHPASLPYVCIDYVFALKSARNVKVTGMSLPVPDGNKGQDSLSIFPEALSTASDHLPVCLTIEF